MHLAETRTIEKFSDKERVWVSIVATDLEGRCFHLWIVIAGNVLEVAATWENVWDKSPRMTGYSVEEGCSMTGENMHDAIRLIIARYNEDVSWVKDVDCDYVVYDKGDRLSANSIVLENIGREAHTYLTHIVREYDTLAPINVFLQGDPFDHIGDQCRGDVQTLRSLIDDVAKREIPFKGFAWFKLKCDRLGRPHDLRKPENQGRWSGWGKDIPLGDVFEKLFAADFPKQLIARAPTGIFAVTKERILTRPKDFYAYALSLVEADPDDSNNTGHAFERLWQHIFNGNTAWNKEDYSLRQKNSKPKSSV